MKYMVLLFIIDVVSQFSDSNESSVDRVIKVGFKSKTAAKDWSDKIIDRYYTEPVPKSQGYRGNRYKVDRIIINYNESTSENIETLIKIFR